jgi:hypothetical protein
MSVSGGYPEYISELDACKNFMGKPKSCSYLEIALMRFRTKFVFKCFDASGFFEHSYTELIESKFITTSGFNLVSRAKTSFSSNASNGTNFEAAGVNRPLVREAL